MRCLCDEKVAIGSMLGDGEPRNGQTFAVRESTDITGPNALHSSIGREDL
jgi:hypothetical protein